MTTDAKLREAWELLTLLGLEDGIAHLEQRPDGSRAIQLRQAVPDHLAVMIYDICGLTLAPPRPVTLVSNSRLARPSRHDKLAEPRPWAA